jgi:hypothetical protein
MGNQISNFLDNSAEKESKAREQLDILMKLADARLDTFQGELEQMFLDKEGAAKRSVPGKRALRFERSVRVDTGSAVSLVSCLKRPVLTWLRGLRWCRGRR